jgi:putative SOS response-associated peptidase YedK
MRGRHGNYPSPCEACPCAAATPSRHRCLHVELLTWGLLPYWTTEPTRAQRLHTFCEWKVVEGGKQPYAIARQDEQPMA